MMFSEKKATQVAAFFIKQGGGKLFILQLMKLMYLAERTSYAKYGEPIIGDALVSMKHGPVLSNTLNYINGEVEPSVWEEWISDRAGHQLVLNKQIADVREDLDELSDADLQILEEVWNQYGSYDRFKLRDLTHKLCEEWEDPGESSAPIPYSRLLRCVGHDIDTARELEQRLKAQRHIDQVFSFAG